jgi:hypothetical protein
MDDLVSDFSAIHRIRDVRTLTGPAFYKLAFRLAAYEGVIRIRMRESLRESGGDTSQQASPYAQSAPREVVPATRVALQAHPEFSRLISFSTMKRQQ